MNEENSLIESLLKIGFTHEDLYKKGILVLSSAVTKTEETKTEEPKTEEPKTEEPKTEEPKTEDPMKELTQAFEAFKTEIRTLVQNTNLKNAVIDEQPKQMTLDEAIMNLTKGGN